MSERKIITFEQLAPNCKHRMGACAIRMGSIAQTPCSKETCPVMQQLPDAEPIIEAADRYKKQECFWGDRALESKLKAALEAAGVKV